MNGPEEGVGGQHPRLFFGTADLPALRARLNHPDGRETWARLLRACENVARGNPQPFETRHIRGGHLAFAYQITGRREFAEAARARAMAIVNQDDWRMASERNPARPVRAGLETGACLRELALAYDWIHDVLSIDERRSIEQACFAKGIEPAMADIREGVYPTLTEDERVRLGQGPVHAGWGSALLDEPDTVPNATRYTTNGMGVLNGPLALAALAFEEVRDTRETLAAAVLQLRRSLAAFCPEGGYPEGPLYWNYYLRHVLIGLVPLMRVKGLDVLRIPFICGTGDYILHHILPGFRECANTSDGYATTHLWPAIPFLAAYCRRNDWQWLARELLRVPWGDDGESLEYSLFYLLFYDPDLPAIAPSPNDTIGLFSGIQHLALRSDWGPEAIHALWLNGPANTHHNHQHLNSLTISAFGRRLLIEPGKYDYRHSRDPRRLAVCHNTLLAGGDEQAWTLDPREWCRRLRAGQWGTVYGLFERLRRVAGTVVATGRVFNAYPGRVAQFDRTLAFLDRRAFFLHDAVVGETEALPDLAWHFHSGGTLERSPAGAVLGNGPARLAIRVHAALPVELGVEAGPTELPDGPAIPRLTVRCAPRGRRLDLFFLLEPYRAGAEPAFDWVAEGSVIRLTGPAQEWRYDPSTRSLTVE